MSQEYTEELRDKVLTRDPLSAAVSLLCRAADIQVAATADPEEKARILKDAALHVIQLTHLCDPEVIYKGSICECVDENDEDEDELDG